MRIHTYAKCGTCRKAVKWLEANGIAFEEIPIRDQPPTRSDLRKMLKVYGGEIRRLFNTSGVDYRELNLKESLPGMSSGDAIDLLAGNGNLVKRPFLLTNDCGAVGFREDEWRDLLL